MFSLWKGSRSTQLGATKRSQSLEIVIAGLNKRNGLSLSSDCCRELSSWGEYLYNSHAANPFLLFEHNSVNQGSLNQSCSSCLKREGIVSAGKGIMRTKVVQKSWKFQPKFRALALFWTARTLLVTLQPAVGMGPVKYKLTLQLCLSFYWCPQLLPPMTIAAGIEKQMC